MTAVASPASSYKNDSEQLRHCVSRLFETTINPPHFGHGFATGRFHEVKSQVG